MRHNFCRIPWRPEKRTLTTLLLLAALSSYSQVSNNQIRDRLSLTINQPLASTTANATVEWACINKALTKKCLVYHNDQWFSFRVPKNGTYYLNIGAQECKADRGVQLIIIEGNPCEIASYRILECISQIRLEDAFVKLESLKLGTEYLVNVDGFLGDFCTFNIELSDQPRGLPREEMERESVEAQWKREEQWVHVEWQITDTLARQLEAFHVYRKHSYRKFEKRIQLPLEANAYGAFVKHYSWTDTLKKEGSYLFQVVGIRQSDHYPVLLSERQVDFYVRKATPVDTMARKSMIPIRLAEGARFSVVVYDQESSDQLSKIRRDFDPARDSELVIDFSEWVQAGHRSFLILVMDEYTQAAREYYFRWTGEKVVRE